MDGEFKTGPTYAAAWFSAGVISPFFIKAEGWTKTLLFGSNRHYLKFSFSHLVALFTEKGQIMIEWTAENTYYFAAIVSALVLIILYFLFLKKSK